MIELIGKFIKQCFIVRCRAAMVHYLVLSEPKLSADSWRHNFDYFILHEEITCGVTYTCSSVATQRRFRTVTTLVILLLLIIIIITITAT